MKIKDDSLFYNEGEKLIYSGEPTKKPYPIIEIIAFALVFIALALTDGFLLGASVFKSVAGENLGAEIALYAIALILHLIPLAFWGFSLVVKFFSAKSTRYLITDKRATILIGKDKIQAETVFFSDVDEIKCVKNSLVILYKEDKMIFKNLENAEEVYKEIKTINF